MAGLTWREVSAPRMDTSDLNQSAGMILGSLRGLGDSFRAREARMREDATNEALARVLQNQDHNATLDMTGMDPRVNKGTVAQAFNQHLNGLVTRAQERDQLEQAQAVAQWGAFANKFMADRMTNGALQWQDAATAAGYNPADAGLVRAMGLLTKDLYQVDNARVDNEGDAQTRAETTKHNRATEANQAAQVANQARETNFRIQQAKEQKAREDAQRLLDDRSMDVAQGAAGWYAKNNWTVEDALIEARRGKFYNSLRTNAERQAYLGRLQDTMTGRQALTSAQRDDGTPLSLRNFETSAGQSSARIGRMIDDMKINFGHNNPGLDIALRASQLKTRPTEASLAATFKKMGDNTPPFMTSMMEGVRRGTFDPRVAQVVMEDYVNGVMDGGGIRANRLMTLGTKELLDQGNPNGALAMYEASLQPLQLKQQLLKELTEKAARERASGQVSNQTWQQLNAILRSEREAGELVDAAIEKSTKRKRN